ncbi:MAG: hypothetical protein V2I97_09455 [Desulfococcaceae bacterium]|jgi:hypothetical protein|nr:hypothetical protein [Desulfococcaceae bacterium]
MKKILYCATALLVLTTSACTTERIIEKRVEVQTPAPPQNSSAAIFFDEFDPDNSALRNVWKSNGKAHWVWQRQTDSSLPGCENGCLKQNSEDIRALNAIMYVATPQMSNGTIKTKARIKYDMSVAPTKTELENLRKFVGTGIIFRMVDENNYYMFRLAGEAGCVLGKMVNNKWIDLKNPRRLDFLEGGRIRPNNWYRLKVKVYDNNIECFINDSPVIQYRDRDAPYTVGRFGLCTFKCFADFEFLEVTEY